jgi:MFS family permease
MVVLLTTLALFVFGTSSWQIIVLCWLVVPLVNFAMFLKVPLAPQVPEEKRQGMKSLVFKPFFIAAFLAIAFGGASEQIAAQWISAFMERGLSVSKIIGDTAGVCSFACMLGVGRLLYGIYGQRVSVHKVMLIGSALAVFCYLAIALSSTSIVSFGGCMVCGIAVSLLWPGTLVIASERYPLAGTWLFAILAAGGDIGASVGPGITGVVIDAMQRSRLLSSVAGSTGLSPEQLGLRSGMLLALVFPLLAFVCLYWMAKSPEDAVGMSSSDHGAVYADSVDPDRPTVSR